jgi:hypothetical protein
MSTIKADVMMGRPGQSMEDAASVDGTVQLTIHYKGVTALDSERELEATYTFAIESKGSDEPVLTLRGGHIDGVAQIQLTKLFDLFEGRVEPAELEVKVAENPEEPVVVEKIDEVPDWAIPSPDDSLPVFVTQLKRNGSDLAKWLETHASVAKARRPDALVFRELG